MTDCRKCELNNNCPGFEDCPKMSATTQPPAPEQQAPHGWKLVPIECTHDMAKAAWGDVVNWADFAAQWKRAILASPAAPEAAKPETERAELIQKLQSVPLCSAVPSLEDERVMLMVGSYCKKAAALLAADSKAGGEPVEPTGLVRCKFDDGCEFCSSPEGGIFTRLIHNPEDVTEAEFYICGKCVHEAIGRYTRPQQQAKPLTDEQRIEIMVRLGITVFGPAAEAVDALISEVERAHGIGDQV